VRSEIKARNHLVPHRRARQREAVNVVSSAKSSGPEGFAGLTTPSAPVKGGFAISCLMSRPPLLFKEGNVPDPLPDREKAI